MHHIELRIMIRVFITVITNAYSYRSSTAAITDVLHMCCNCVIIILEKNDPVLFLNYLEYFLTADIPRF